MLVERQFLPKSNEKFHSGICITGCFFFFFPFSFLHFSLFFFGKKKEEKINVQSGEVIITNLKWRTEINLN